jgi:para-aminobenzoate synthetase / 4-amino-4-deoxychorismate lyase
VGAGWCAGCLGSCGGRVLAVVGLVAPPSAPVRARFNVAIRTVVVDRATDMAVYGTGGGITWGSDAAGEYAELLTKPDLLPTTVPVRSKR